MWSLSWNANCCGWTDGVCTAQRHNPSVGEFAMLYATGRHVAVEQRDPTGVPNASLGIVQFACKRMTSALSLWDDADFLKACAAEQGFATEQRYAQEVGSQY